jgi:hypothetical protein
MDKPKWTLELQKSELQQYIWASVDAAAVGQKNTEPLDTKRRPSPIVITVFYKRHRDFFSLFSQKFKLTVHWARKFVLFDKVTYGYLSVNGSGQSVHW